MVGAIYEEDTKGKVWQGHISMRTTIEAKVKGRGSFGISLKELNTWLDIENFRELEMPR